MSCEGGIGRDFLQKRLCAAVSCGGRVYCRFDDRAPGLMTPLSPMLHLCSQEGCSAIVLGSGTCVEHDRPSPKSMTSTLLNQAIVAIAPKR